MSFMDQTRPDWRAATMALALLTALLPTPAGAVGDVSCSISATPLAFGRYVPYAGFPSDFTTTISLICTTSGSTPVAFRGTVTLTGRGGPDGRQLTDGANVLRYQLYVDPARTVAWGQGGAGGGSIPVSGVVGPTTPLRQELMVYGRILARQATARVGHYADQITAVLNY